ESRVEVVFEVFTDPDVSASIRQQTRDNFEFRLVVEFHPCDSPIWRAAKQTLACTQPQAPIPAFRDDTDIEMLSQTFWEVQFYLLYMVFSYTKQSIGTGPEAAAPILKERLNIPLRNEVRVENWPGITVW